MALATAHLAKFTKGVEMALMEEKGVLFQDYLADVICGFGGEAGENQVYISERRGRGL